MEDKEKLIWDWLSNTGAVAALGCLTWTPFGLIGALLIILFDKDWGSDDANAILVFIYAMGVAASGGGWMCYLNRKLERVTFRRDVLSNDAEHQREWRIGLQRLHDEERERRSQLAHEFVDDLINRGYTHGPELRELEDQIWQIVFLNDDEDKEVDDE